MFYIPLTKYKNKIKIVVLPPKQMIAFEISEMNDQKKKKIKENLRK